MVEKKIAPKKSRIKKNTKLGNSWEPPKYLQSLIASINEGARAAQGGLFLMLFVGLYVLATSVSTTDEDLFLGRSVNISQIGAALPVSVSLAIAPIILVFFHLYTLTRYALLASNLRHFKVHLAPLTPDERENCQHLLSNVEFVVSFIESDQTRIFNSLWRRLSLLLLVILPVTTLLMIQISSLRYQSEIILWVQRMVLSFDLIGLVWFFHLDPWGDKVNPKLQPDSRWALLAARFPMMDWTAVRYWMRLVWFPVLIFAFDLAYLTNAPADADAGSVRFETSFGRKLEFLEVGAGPIPWALLPEWVNPDFQSIGRVGRAKYITGWALIIASQPLDHFLCPWLNWGCRYLRVERQTLIGKAWDPSEIIEFRKGKTEYFKSEIGVDGVKLRSRNFRFAALKEIRLYAADLFETDLRKADLSNAHLQNANLMFSQFQGANLINAQLQGAKLGFAKSQGANMRLAQLQGAVLFGAKLQNANLFKANMRGTNLGLTSFFNADLSIAQLQGADLSLSQLQGVNLSDAHLQGADFLRAQLQGANLSGANLQGANLTQAGLEGADLSDAGLQGVNFSGAKLLGTILVNAETWRAGWKNSVDEPLILYPGGEIKNKKMNSAEILRVRDEALQGLSEEARSKVKEQFRYLSEEGDLKDDKFYQALKKAQNKNGDSSSEQRSEILSGIACGDGVYTGLFFSMEDVASGLIKLHGISKDISKVEAEEEDGLQVYFSASHFAKTILSLHERGQCPAWELFPRGSQKLLGEWAMAEK